MQKIEKWRLEELALILKQLAELLNKGDNREWANVFLHFHQESQYIIASKAFNLEQIIKLIMNIKNCCSGASSFMNLVLHHENEKEKIRFNQDLFKARTRLLKIMAELEDRSVEYVS
jgi:hypothetical protein